MKTFYSHLARKTAKAESLRMAQLELLRQGGDMSKPFYWAGFSLTGEGQETIERNSHDDGRTKRAPRES
jgi:CHAT domain-containing protein